MKYLFDHSLPCLVIVVFALSALGRPVHAGTPVVCVAPFADNTGSIQWSGMSQGISDLLAATLSQRQELRVVERERLNAILEEQALSLSMVAEPKNAVKVGRLLGADKIVVGGVMILNKKLVVTAQVVDVSSATVIAARTLKGKPDELLELCTRLAADLGKALGVKIKVQPVAAKDAEKSPMASLHFMRGLGLYHAGNFDRGAMELMICIDLDPGHPTARYWLAQCYYRGQEYDHAAIEFRKFLKHFPQAAQARSARQLLKECTSQKRK